MTKRKPRPMKELRRPFLLGTDDTLPPLDVPWQMWSNSSSPYEQGLVQFEFTPKGLAVQWFGMDEDRYVIEWHELAVMAGMPPKFAEEVQGIKERAAAEGYLWGLAKALERFGDRHTSPIELPVLVREPAKADEWVDL